MSPKTAFHSLGLVWQDPAQVADAVVPQDPWDGARPDSG
jgi:hypothetical protein